MKIDRATREQSVQKTNRTSSSLPHVSMAVAMRQQKKNVDNFISANLFALLRTLRQAPLNFTKRSEYQMLIQLQSTENLYWSDMGEKKWNIIAKFIHVTLCS